MLNAIRNTVLAPPTTSLYKRVVLACSSERAASSLAASACCSGGIVLSKCNKVKASSDGKPSLGERTKKEKDWSDETKGDVFGHNTKNWRQQNTAHHQKNTVGYSDAWCWRLHHVTCTVLKILLEISVVLANTRNTSLKCVTRDVRKACF